MPTPREVSSEERDALWAQVRAEFPHDEMLQEVHFVRLLHAVKMEGFSKEERISWFNGLLPRSSGKG